MKSHKYQKTFGKICSKCGKAIAIKKEDGTYYNNKYSKELDNLIELTVIMKNGRLEWGEPFFRHILRKLKNFKRHLFYQYKEEIWLCEECDSE